MGRPHGEITLALRAAAAAGPATVKQLAHRACVGQAQARMTASRMQTRGELVAVEKGARPAVLRLAAPDEAAGASKGADLASAMSAWCSRPD